MVARSKVEISGQWAPFYDRMMDVLFLGGYPRFINEVAQRMRVAPGDEILDLGSGTGRNARLLANKTTDTGRVVGVDISRRMLRYARRQCRRYEQIEFVNRRIEQPLPFSREFDIVFISFALHGFENEDKQRILANAREPLKPGGRLWILDYSEFDLDKLWFPLRWIFRRFECELAAEFLNLDLEEMLSGAGFGDFACHHFFRGYLRLLGARKQ